MEYFIGVNVFTLSRLRIPGQAGYLTKHIIKQSSRVRGEFSQKMSFGSYQTPEQSNSGPPNSGSDLGNSLLVEKIVDEIMRKGPIDFAKFMEMVLYDPAHGYYESYGPIGWKGDFYTSEDLHSVYGEMLGEQLIEASELIVGNGPVTIVEMGPGRGVLCRDILAFLERRVPKVRSNLRYVLVERSARMIERQRELLQPFLSAGWSVSWCSGIDTFFPQGFTGVIFSNELIDAFPVHRIIVRNGVIKECFVSYEDERFVEREDDPSGAVTDYVQRFIHEQDIVLEEGVRAEVNLNAIDWMKSVARVLKKGIVMTIDYGYPAYELYDSKRSHGTLLCYARHRVSDDPYVGVGHQDMTAHVDFTALATVGEERGLAVTGFTNQQSFLLGLGVAEKTTASNEELIARLIHPNGLGRTHKVLIQHTGIPCPSLAGLKYRPFFDSSLFSKGGKYASG